MNVRSSYVRLPCSDLADRFQTLLPNPAAAVLELKDSLGPGADQVGRLEGVRDTGTGRFAAIADTIRKALANEGANPDPMRAMSLVRPRFEAGREQVPQALEQVRAIRTPDQW